MDPRAPAVKVLVCAQSDVGRARQTNEDACSITELESGTVIDAMGKDHKVDVGHKGVLLAVSDGMGGHQAGEVASALVIESLSRELVQEKQGPLHKQLEDAVHRANRRVHNAARSAERHGMGATLTAVFIKGTEAFIAEVGDSRGYLLRNGRLRQITRDQSMVQMLVDQGVLSPQDARKAPGKNVILQAVGLAPDVRVAIGRLELRRGDRLLLCSDGVSNQITDEELRQILTKSEPREACETMIALANDRGGEDNETVIVADVLGEDLNEPMEFETVTSTFEVMQAFEAKPSKRPRRTPVPLRPPDPSDFAAPKKPASAPPPGAPDDAAPVEMEADPPPAKIPITPPPAVSRTTTSGAEAAETASDGKADGRSDGTHDGGLAPPSANSSGAMPPMQTEPEKRSWVQSLLGRLSRTKTKQ
ncbi:MAG TPA: Stp1/IreP family PP2C-type Ser/Thr phosphatase [Kofleriaceae bacterium]|nr:Stp1/IreP family PP2C-type Ser/Thr phosphatase [Kofleriaceae bacterium]